MNLNPLRWFADRKSNSSLDIFRELYGSASAKAGVAVNWQTAMQCTAAMACARVIAEGIAQVPFRLMLSADGKRQGASAHPLYDLLAVAPNEWQTSFEFREQIGLHLVFTNNAFIWQNKINGRTVELLAFEPQRVTVKRDGYSLRYAVADDNGRAIEVPANEMWHIRGPSWNGWLGLDGVKLAREAIGLALAAEDYSAGVFANGGKMPGVLTTDATLNEKQRIDLRASWDAANEGRGNAHKTSIVWGGLKWMSMVMQNDQAQLLEQRRHQVEEVCRSMRVLPVMVGHDTKTQSYASVEQQFIAHVVHTLGPWYVRLEGSANARLLTPADRARGHYFKFFANALMRGAAKDRAEFYRTMYGIASLNPNEIRELEDLDPYDGGEQFRAPLNMEDPANPAAGRTGVQ